MTLIITISTEAFSFFVADTKVIDYKGNFLGLNEKILKSKWGLVAGYGDPCINMAYRNKLNNINDIQDVQLDKILMNVIDVECSKEQVDEVTKNNIIENTKILVTNDNSGKIIAQLIEPNRISIIPEIGYIPPKFLNDGFNLRDKIEVLKKEINVKDLNKNPITRRNWNIFTAFYSDVSDNCRSVNKYITYGVHNTDGSIQIINPYHL